MPLQNEGGWLNDTIVDHFADFSRIVFREFGDRVKFWLTFNEPRVFCLADWNYITHDEFENPPERQYICAHNVIKAHARAYRIYDTEFRPNQNGQMGITLHYDWAEPRNRSDPTHIEAMHRSMHFRYGWWANPLLRGEYPPIMRTLIDSKSEAEGRNSSRLPTFDSAWTAIVNGTLDFLGLNHYSTGYLIPSDGSNPGLDGDANLGNGGGDPSWNSSGIGWSVVPFGIRRTIGWIWDEYKMPIYITENGYGGAEAEGLDDEPRTNFYRAYINQVLKAVKLDGADVRSYAAWSLLDNYEWSQGYMARFGIHYVDFTNDTRPRTAKNSVAELTKIFQDNGFPPGK